MERSLSHYGINPLYQYLSKVFGEQETERLIDVYKRQQGKCTFGEINVDLCNRFREYLLTAPQLSLIHI